MKDLRGKYIWIIGASSGIGHALAHTLSSKGAHLILSARNADKLHDLNTNLGGHHAVRPLDVSDHSALTAVMDDIPDKIPQLDSVIFLAAIYTPHSTKNKDIDFIHKMLDVNIGGAFNVVDITAPYFKDRKYGQIVLCGSVAGYRGLPAGQPYCATKAAIINLAESLKIECEPHNIDVKVINPGFVKTPLTDKNNFPMPMIISAEDAAQAIAKDLTSRRFEIHFPRKFTFIMKLLRLLPNWLYFSLARKMRNVDL